MFKKTIGFSMFFEVSGGRKSIKNRSKSDLKVVLSGEAKATPKNAPKWLQHGSKIGPSWGHVGLQNRHGPAQERSQDDVKKCLQEADFWSHLGPDQAKTTMGRG